MTPGAGLPLLAPSCAPGEAWNPCLASDDHSPGETVGPKVGVLMDTPRIARGLGREASDDPSDPLRLVRDLMVQDHKPAALAAAERLAPTLTGRPAAAAWFAAGLLHRAEGRANLASESFTRSRQAGGPLTAWASWFEAEQDLARGRAGVAQRECVRYLERYPEGYHRDDCEQLIAFALAEQGRVEEAEAAADAWDEAHEVAPIGNQVRLTLAASLEEQHPRAALALYQTLANNFHAPLTGRRAAEGLARLRAHGLPEATLPDDIPSLRARAESFRVTGQLDEAWNLYQRIADLGTDITSVTRWVSDRLTSFAWSARKWDVLEEHYAAAYQEDPDADVAWYAYRAAARGGEYARAKRWIDKGLSDHADHRRWRRNGETIARTLLVAQDYEAAATQFDALAAKGGHTGRRNALYAAFSRWRSGDTDGAEKGFTKLIDDGKGLETEARYWRARVTPGTSDSSADEAWVAEHAPDSWYALLLERDTPRLGGRDGTWPHKTTRQLAGQVHDQPHVPSAHGASQFGAIASLTKPARALSTPSLSWPHPSASVPAVASLQAPRQPLVLLDSPSHDLAGPPAAYPEGPFHLPETAAETFREVAARYHRAFPALQTIEDLASVGLYDLSGALMNHTYKEWNDAYRRRDSTARDMARRFESSTWRELFLFSRDHHHTARHTYSLHRHLTDEADLAVTRQLQRPIAHGEAVWTACRRHGLDPYLVLGLMQTESIFDAQAVSPVGARGPMQVMPRTGHLLASLMDDRDFRPGMLHDPNVAVSYGITYLGLLMQRFDNAFPLAVASYNGGPHNVSSWLAGTGQDMPIDLWVEHIPFGETRRYVRKVTARYASYIRTWQGSEPHVVLPATPYADRPEVVNF